MQTNNPLSPAFDYTLLDQETRTFVQQTTEETHGLLLRSAEHILRIGQGLQAVKARLPYGHFLAWLKAEFGMSRSTANNFIHVAEKFAGRCPNIGHLSASILYELAAPSTSDELIEQVEQGQLPATLEAIKEAKRAQKQAEEIERQSRLEVQEIQQQVLVLQDDNTHLKNQLAHVEYEASRASPPPIHIQEVQIPPAMTAQMETLQQQLRAAAQERDALVQRVEELGAEARAEVLNRNKEERGIQMRRQWKQTTAEFQQGGSKLLTGWPTPIDLYAFTEEEWTHLFQTQEIARLIVEACEKLKQVSRQVIEADGTP